MNPVVVGLISDTHGLVRPEIARALAGVDLIANAGEVGGRGVLDALSAIARCEAVSGNVDDRDDPMLPRQRVIPVGGLTLHVSHGDEFGSPTAELMLARYSGDILAFGHTHRPLAVRENGRLVVNPGSAGPRRFNLPVTIAKLSVRGRHADVEILAIV